jgi:hypothetical protein
MAVRMTEVAAGVHRLEDVYTNWYLISIRTGRAHRDPNSKKHGPHWDILTPGGPKKGRRGYPDGTMEQKVK